jgi:hypothetical protein
MKKEDSGYYAKVMVPMYTDIIKTRNITNYNQAKKLHEHLKCFNDGLMNLSQQCHNIYHMPIQRAAYILGFPVHTYIPGKDVLEKALIQLNAKGEKYYDDVENYYKGTEHTHPLGGKSTFINEKDTLLSDVWTYSPFDRVVFNQSGKNFVFTRPEFPYLLEKKINPHTKVALSSEFLDVVRCRYNMAKTYKLGESEPLRGLFEKMGKVEEDNIPELSEMQTIENTRAPTDNFFNGMMVTLVEELLGDRYPNYGGYYVRTI